MAGTFKNTGAKASQDILFDLTPEDTQLLQESDLLQLVNYGQLARDIEVFGTDGRKYTIELALLWDEDYVDILKKTQSYSEDSILRVKVLRRLKMFKAIQKIDEHSYADPEDRPAQRELWALLCRMSDAQMDFIDAKYHEIELERDLSITDAMGIMGDQFNKQSSTYKAPRETPKEEQAEQPVKPESKDDKPTDSVDHEKIINEHTQLFQQVADNAKTVENTMGNIATEMIEGQPINTTPDNVDEGLIPTVTTVGSPKQKRRKKVTKKKVVKK